ncbi:unnamed protein product [Hermetia illucens]|uniref:Uncharacterized protein n=1 Tax=Hermetia illucens TaxID=343691 RepID=A0A7R8UJJ9_HERIL|nr:unnamed protein product [Hermetia illucens]
MWPGFDRCGSRNGTNPSRQETLPEVEHISTIAGSLGSIGTLSQCGNEPVYDTDHTELNSDYDEAEYRRELLKDKWKQLFDMGSIVSFMIVDGKTAEFKMHFSP